MNNALYNTVMDKKQRIVSPWFVMSVALALFLTISTIAIYAYQKKVGTPKETIQTAQIEIDKQRLLSQPDVINTNWLHTLNPLVKNVRGRLIWSNTKQKGIMEFSRLPALPDNQHYRLYIYDLNSASSTPIPARFQTPIKPQNKSKTRLIPFATDTIIKAPFKFELLLEEEDSKNKQPLLLAQP